jgi:hypothetical protein
VHPDRFQERPFVAVTSEPGDVGDLCVCDQTVGVVLGDDDLVARVCSRSARVASGRSRAPRRVRRVTAERASGAWVTCPRCESPVGLGRFAESDEERGFAVGVCPACATRVDLASGAEE